MKKIPTMFVRDEGPGPRLVLDQVAPGCEWVVAGEGVATRKFDGQCCSFIAGSLYKRREVREGHSVPEDFFVQDVDRRTKKIVGWVPVGDGPEDTYFREALKTWIDIWPAGPREGTYELCGPKVEKNREGLESHQLIPHGDETCYPEPPRTFDGLRQYLSETLIEGIVFWHPDGRRAKIKARDFGMKRREFDAIQ